MRVLIAVLALVATPVIASVAQAQGSTPPASERQNCANDHRWQEGNHLGDKNASKQGCDPSGGGTGGIGTISGMVFFGTVWSPTAPGVLSGTVNVTGPVTVSQPALMTGNFSFTGLPAGTYTVCAAPSSFFHQTLPSNNGCYTVTLGGTQWAAGPLYFGVM
jgi:hypothetical protein